MKKLVATAPRVAELKDYEDREIKSNEVKVKVEFASPKHGTELADFRGTTPFVDGNLMKSGAYLHSAATTSQEGSCSAIFRWEICS